ncbi:aminoacyl-tRNA deacylase [Sphaerimonospora mesophila]|uniref:aminoacyl-tRNA deacylase n=1 Tax=Sphaerimonospora mesophila TaxID=37483 RepID=UPI0006E3DC62
MKDALAIHRRLLARQIHHEIVRLPRPLTCADDLPEMLGATPETCVRVSVFEVPTRGRIDPVAVVGSVAAHPTAQAVGTVLHAHDVRPASSFVVNSVTDYPDRLVCPLLLPDDLTVLVDQRVVDRLDPDEFAHTPTGERRTALRIRALHLFNLISGKRVDLETPRRQGLTRRASPMRTA